MPVSVAHRLNDSELRTLERAERVVRPGDPALNSLVAGYALANCAVTAATAALAC